MKNIILLGAAVCLLASSANVTAMRMSPGQAARMSQQDALGITTGASTRFNEDERKPHTRSITPSALETRDLLPLVRFFIYTDEQQKRKEDDVSALLQTSTQSGTLIKSLLKRNVSNDPRYKNLSSEEQDKIAGFLYEKAKQNKKERE